MKNVNRRRGYDVYAFTYRTVLGTEFTLPRKLGSVEQMLLHIANCSPGMVTIRMLCKNLKIQPESVRKYVVSGRKLCRALGVRAVKVKGLGYMMTEDHARILKHALIDHSPVLIRQLDSAGRVVFSEDAGRHQPETLNTGYTNGQDRNHQTEYRA